MRLGGAEVTSRIISGLKFAVTCGTPFHVGVSRPRGAKAHGVRYEKQIAKALPLARHGQWFQFIDANGHGTCQTDLLLEFPDLAVVLEAKYTWTLAGHLQVEKLYQPVVARALGKPCIGLVICKALRDEVEMGEVMVTHRLMDAISWSQRKRTVLHWLGESPFLKLDPGTRLGIPMNPHTELLVPARKRA